MVPRKNIFGARCSQAVLSALTRLMLVQEERGCRFIIFGWWGPGLTVTYWAYPRFLKTGTSKSGKALGRGLPCNERGRTSTLSTSRPMRLKGGARVPSLQFIRLPRLHCGPSALLYMNITSGKLTPCALASSIASHSEFFILSAAPRLGLPSSIMASLLLLSSPSLSSCHTLLFFIPQNATNLLPKFTLAVLNQFCIVSFRPPLRVRTSFQNSSVGTKFSCSSF
mmetsp:Transcript_28303/g.76448  ORF Transcript_28303/g.76448 Transcript_28303/m.76448 type:complete len:224 (+) Transcript_28303:827-1498(+)